MNAEVKKLWVDDLRAHPELQGKMYMKTPDGKFCCLGRLCQLAIDNGVAFQWEYMEKLNTGILPRVVAEWAEIESRPAINGHMLENFNDCGNTFVKIADMIEANL